MPEPGESLQNSKAPLRVDDIAARVDLHVNTTRFHLDALIEMGLVERVNQHRATPGRPRALYRASAVGARAGQRSYRLLAEILTDYLVGQTRTPSEPALEAGNRWGRRFVGHPPRPRPRGAEAQTRELVAHLDEIGFAPEAEPTRRTWQIRLHHCPFREAAKPSRRWSAPSIWA